MAFTEQQLEWIKCARDPVYYANNYAHIFDAEKNTIYKMKCFDYQEDCLRSFHDNKKNIVLKSRQCLPEGSLIDVPEGSTEIQNLKKQDRLYSYNIELSQVEPDSVEEVWMSGIKECVRVYFDDGSNIEAGEIHPLWVPSKKEWIAAGKIEAGTDVLRRIGSDVVVLKVFSVERIGERRCWDISVRNNENFFCGGILVHNTGLSVVTAVFVAWKLIFQSNQKVLIIANDGAGARRFLKTVKMIIESNPTWLNPASRTVWNQTYIELSNNSQCEAKASSPEAGRGEALTLLVLDEAAFIENIDDIWTAASFALSMTNGKTIAISTPKGMGNWYHKEWVKAKKDWVSGDNDYSGFVPIEVHWTQNPIASKGLEWKTSETGDSKYPWSPWYQQRCDEFEGDEVKIAQELDLSFEGSKRRVIPTDLIKFYNDQSKRAEAIPIKYIGFNFTGVINYSASEAMTLGYVTAKPTKFRIYKMPEQGEKYILASDVARGDATDYSTIQIINVRTMEQVAEWADKISPDLLACLIYYAGTLYNQAYVAVEGNNFGLGTALDLKNKMKYKNMHISKTVKEMYVDLYKFNLEEGESVPCFMTTKQTRPLIVKTMLQYLREKQVIINSPRLVAEFETFIYDSQGRIGHEKGSNDDLIIAYCIALYIRDTCFEMVMAAKELYISMIEGISTQKKYGGVVAVDPEDQARMAEIEKTNGSAIYFGSDKPADGLGEDLGWLYG